MGAKSWPDVAKLSLVVERSDGAAAAKYVPVRAHDCRHPMQLKNLLAGSTVLVHVGDDGVFRDTNAVWNSRPSSATVAKINATNRKPWFAYQALYAARVQDWGLQGQELPCFTIAKDILAETGSVIKDFGADLKIIDLGCGDKMLLAQMLLKLKPAHSLEHMTCVDFCPSEEEIPLDQKGYCPRFFKNDIAVLPDVKHDAKHAEALANNHVAVLCLSLLGSNWVDIVAKAHRVLAPGGYLYIANTVARHVELSGTRDDQPFMANMKTAFQLAGTPLATNTGRFKIFRFQKGQGDAAAASPANARAACVAAAVAAWGHDKPEYEAPVHGRFTVPTGNEGGLPAAAGESGAHPDVGQLLARDYRGRAHAIADTHGDPRSSDAWQWYTSGQRVPYEGAATADSAMSTDADAGASSAVAAGTAAKATTKAAAATVTAVYQQTAAFRSRPACAGAGAASAPDSADAKSAVCYEFTLPSATSEAPEAAALHVPDAQAQTWRGDAGSAAAPSEVPPQWTLAGKRKCKFLIFTPSTRRHGVALLDLSATFPSDVAYTQVVVVTESEVELYQRLWPHLTILQLPESAEALGVGASRHWIQKFATQVVGATDFPYCFVADDSLSYWKGVTLVDDPHPQFGAVPTPHTANSASISLWQVLEHFQEQRFAETQLKELAVLGFEPHNPADTCAKHAYERAHVRGAAILNLALLHDSDIYYNPNLFAWEDLELNERVSAAGLAVCKCLRYRYHLADLRVGGFDLPRAALFGTPTRRYSMIPNVASMIARPGSSPLGKEAMETRPDGGSPVGLRGFMRCVAWALGCAPAAARMRVCMRVRMCACPVRA